MGAVQYAVQYASVAVADTIRMLNQRRRTQEDTMDSLDGQFATLVSDYKKFQEDRFHHILLSGELTRHSPPSKPRADYISYVTERSNNSDFDNLVADYKNFQEYRFHHILLTGEYTRHSYDTYHSGRSADYINTVRGRFLRVYELNRHSA